MIKETLTQAKTRMTKASEDLRVELAAVRTGRASTSFMDNLKVEYYGTHDAAESGCLAWRSLIPR